MVVNTDRDARARFDPQTTWVSVAEAAEKTGVATGTVRQWYRSGRLPTQRALGDRGSFLVPLDAVVALVRGDEEGDAGVADRIDLNASYWSAQTEAARRETAAARHELAEARDELASAEDERGRLREENASLRAELTDARAELDRHRAIWSATASITDNSWLALPTNTYRSPVRPQGMSAGTAARADAALAGLLADTTPDGDPAPDPGPGRPASADEGAGPPILDVAPRGPAQAVPDPTRRTKPVFGIHEDDLLPQPDKGGRRGRRSQFPQNLIG